MYTQVGALPSATPQVTNKGPSTVSGRMPFRRFTDLDDAVLEPEWLWNGFLAAGQLTMLAGNAFAGKSMLIGGLLSALESSEAFLGRPTRATTALLVTEEDEVVLANRRKLLGSVGLESEFVSRADSLPLDWARLVEGATQRAIDVGHRLVVFDTFAGLAGLLDEQENDAGAITSRLRLLRAAAAEDLAILFLHHMNGYGQPRGSKAFRAGVDISLRLFREPTTSKVVRLEGEGRFPGLTPAKLKAELVQASDRWFYQPLTAPPAEARSGAPTADARLLAALEDAGCDGLTYEQLGTMPGLSLDIAKKRLPGQLGRLVATKGRGVKGDPLRYYLTGSC